jgi:polyisoprenoid-binding protein YceI
LIVAVGLLALPTLAAAQTDTSFPLTVTAARVSLAGTSNIQAFTASTTDVRMSRLVLAPWDGNRLLSAARPGGVEAFEIAIRAASLSSPTAGLAKNMHQALKVAEHPDITFRLLRLEPAASASGLVAVGMLGVAGVEREVALDLKFAVNASTIIVMGEVALLMNDFGIAPPTAMLGMLKTDPTITVTFETVLGLPNITF